MEPVYKFPSMLDFGNSRMLVRRAYCSTSGNSNNGGNSRCLQNDIFQPRRNVGVRNLLQCYARELHSYKVGTNYCINLEDLTRHL